MFCLLTDPDIHDDQLSSPSVTKTPPQPPSRLINSAEPRWSKLAANLLKEWKKKNVVVAAIANRWVRWLSHQMLSAQLAA